MSDSSKRGFAIGVDYGTNSVRALVVDLADGREVGHRASTTIPAARRASCWTRKTRTSPGKTRPTTSRASIASVGGAVQAAKRQPRLPARAASSASASTRPARRRMPGRSPGHAAGHAARVPQQPGGPGLAVEGPHQPCRGGRDHREGRARSGDGYLAKCGGTYSSEWYWSKILHCKRTGAEGLRGGLRLGRAGRFRPGLLTGNLDPDTLPRGICAAGHKAMYQRAVGRAAAASSSWRSSIPALAALRRALRHARACRPTARPAG